MFSHSSLVCLLLVAHHSPSHCLAPSTSRPSKAASFGCRQGAGAGPAAGCPHGSAGATITLSSGSVISTGAMPLGWQSLPALHTVAAVVTVAQFKAWASVSPWDSV